jgi:hypothetical protein
LQGWQTKAVKISGFDRVRYTGKPVHSIEALKYTQLMASLVESTDGARAKADASWRASAKVTQ